MADNKGRQLQRLAATGDAEAGLQLANHAARTGQTELLTEGILGGLSLLGTNELRKIQYAAGVEAAKKIEQDKQDNPKKYKYEKAVEFASTELGKVSLGEFVATIEDFVKECSEADVTTHQYLYRTQHGYGHRSTKACAEKAFEVLNKYTGNFVISSSSPIRIYALKEEVSSEEKERRRKAKEKIKIEQELKAQKESRDKLVKQLEKQKRREARLKKRLEEMDEKIGG